MEADLEDGGEEREEEGTEYDDHLGEEGHVSILRPQHRVNGGLVSEEVESAQGDDGRGHRAELEQQRPHGQEETLPPLSLQELLQRA